MFATILPPRARMLLAVAVVCAGAATARAGGPVGAWLTGSQGYSVNYYAPGHYGYNFDNFNPSYYGGYFYREYYSFGRGTGLATFPDCPPGPQWLYDNRNWIGTTRVHPWKTAFPLPGGPTTLPRSSECAYLSITVPEGAAVLLDGAPTEQTGPKRVYVTPALKPNERYSYEVKVRWVQDGKPVEQTQTVQLQAGSRVEAIFPLPEPARLPEGIGAAKP